MSGVRRSRIPERLGLASLCSQGWRGMNKADIVRQLFNGMKLRTNVLIVAVLGDLADHGLWRQDDQPARRHCRLVAGGHHRHSGGTDRYRDRRADRRNDGDVQIASGASGHARADRRCVDGPYPDGARIAWRTRYRLIVWPLRMLRGGLFVVSMPPRLAWGRPPWACRGVRLTWRAFWYNGGKTTQRRGP